VSAGSDLGLVDVHLIGFPIPVFQRAQEHSDALMREFSLILLSEDHDVPRRLLALIESVRGAFHRYESLLVPSNVMIERVAAEHAEIAGRLAVGDIPGAVEALRLNWVHGMQRILDNASSAYFTD